MRYTVGAHLAENTLLFTMEVQSRPRLLAYIVVAALVSTGKCFYHTLTFLNNVSFNYCIFNEQIKKFEKKIFGNNLQTKNVLKLYYQFSMC